jgi:hypothetical protein
MSSPPILSSLQPVSVAIYGALNVQSLLALAPDGVGDAIPQGAAFPFVLYEVSEAAIGGFGRKPKFTVELRLHVFSRHAGMSEAQQVMNECIRLLSTAPSITDFEVVGDPFHDETIPFSDELVAGVPVRELVANFRLVMLGT